MAQELTKAELTFVQRMHPHFLAGKSVEEAAKAVLADDERIYAAFCDRAHSQYVPTADERGASYRPNERQGDVIVRELSTRVYRELRA